MFAILTHPADLAARDADHESVGFDVFIDHSTGADEGVLANRDAADDGAVGAESDTCFDEGVSVFVFACDERAGVVDIRKNHAGTAKDPVFEYDIVVEGDVVLDFAVVTNRKRSTNPILDS